MVYNVLNDSLHKFLKVVLMFASLAYAADDIFFYVGLWVQVWREGYIKRISSAAYAKLANIRTVIICVSVMLASLTCHVGGG